MTTTDWIIDIVLVLIVFRQLREARIDRKFVLLPLAIMVFVVHSYVHDIPTGGNDLLLIGTLVAAGAAFGIGGGLATRVRSDGNGHALVKAGAVAAVLWVVGMGSRMAFYLWSEHGGADAIGTFSVAHHITGADAWVAAFVLMAMAEVGTRMATILIKAARLRSAGTVPAVTPELV